MSDSPKDDKRNGGSVEKRPRSPVNQDSPREDRRGRSRSSGSRRGGAGWGGPSRPSGGDSPVRPSGYGEDRKDDGSAGNVIYIAKLSRNTREADLKDGFSRYGAIRNITLKHSFAFITFEKPESAREAIERMNGAKFVNDEQLVVELSGTDNIIIKTNII